MTKQHTPGPWHITKDTIPGQFCTYTKVRDQHDGVIAVMHINEDANAQLLAAAPEILAALNGILQWWMESDGGDDMPADLFDGAHAAVDKAKGGAK